MKKMPMVHQSVLHMHQSKKCILIILAILCMSGFCTSIIYAQSKEKTDIPASSGASAKMEAAFNTLDADTLYDLRTPYVGDASAVGKLLYALSDLLPSGAYKIELDTEDTPYVLRLAYEEEPTEGEDETSHRMNVAGTLLLALIDNLDEVQWTFPTHIDGEEVFYTGYWNLSSVSDNYSCTPEEVKDFGISEENLQTLLDKFSQSISVIGGADGPTSISIGLPASKEKDSPAHD
ncbi:MAG: DUF4825 domain-containing protein [Eubacteriales bacterium]|nr:DUF4825 domain-containing protein [Eubacteriales bacterium]